MPDRPWPTDPCEFILDDLRAWKAADVERVIDAFHVPSLIHTDGAVIHVLGDAIHRAG